MFLETDPYYSLSQGLDDRPTPPPPSTSPLSEGLDPPMKVMGKHELGQRNDKGERLCEFCDMNELVITGTNFQQKNVHKTRWVSSNRITTNQIDHVLIDKRLRDSVKDTIVYSK